MLCSDFYFQPVFMLNWTHKQCIHSLDNSSLVLGEGILAFAFYILETNRFGIVFLIAEYDDHRNRPNNQQTGSAHHGMVFALNRTCFASVSYPVKWPKKACHHGDCPAEFNSSLKRDLLVVQNRRHPHTVRCVWNE